MLEGVTTQYREYAINEIEAFVTATEGFTNAVLDGDIEKAKELYAPARMHYERAEPIAEVFGDLDPKIDARKGDVPDANGQDITALSMGYRRKNTTKGYEEYAEAIDERCAVISCQGRNSGCKPRFTGYGSDRFTK